MLGSYSWGGAVYGSPVNNPKTTGPTFDYIHTGYIIFYLYIAHIFLLNYLVAILSTAYEKKMETGKFSYNQMRYYYIERFYVAFEEPNGYYELVTHSPPINILLVLIMPAAISPDRMIIASGIFSTLMFWSENIIVYIPFFLIDEILALPYVYFSNLVQIITKAGKEVCYLLPFWIFIGPFFLIKAIFEDLISFIRVLCDYQVNNENAERMLKEDIINDKICLYNEIIDAVRCVYFIFLEKHANINPKFRNVSEKLPGDTLLEEAIRIT